MNIYIGSAIAVRDIQGEDDLSGIRHLPYVVLAESISEASEKMKQHAFKDWKPSDGWRSHRIVIIPAGAEFYESAMGVYELGGFDLSEDEEPQTFHFIPDTFEAEALM